MGFVVRRRERLPCRPGRGVFPRRPSLTDSLPPRKKGRPESAGQKKSQQTKKKQIKSTIIKRRCYKENKLHKIYWFLTKLDICGKDIRSSSRSGPATPLPCQGPWPPQSPLRGPRTPVPQREATNSCKFYLQTLLNLYDTLRAWMWDLNIRSSHTVLSFRRAFLGMKGKLRWGENARDWRACSTV